MTEIFFALTKFPADLAKKFSPLGQAPAPRGDVDARWGWFNEFWESQVPEFWLSHWILKIIRADVTVDHSIHKLDPDYW